MPVSQRPPGHVVQEQDVTDEEEKRRAESIRRLLSQAPSLEKVSSSHLRLSQTIFVLDTQFASFLLFGALLLSHLQGIASISLFFTHYLFTCYSQKPPRLFDQRLPSFLFEATELLEDMSSTTSSSGTAGGAQSPHQERLISECWLPFINNESITNKNNTLTTLLLSQVSAANKALEHPTSKSSPIAEVSKQASPSPSTPLILLLQVDVQPGAASSQSKAPKSQPDSGTMGNTSTMQKKMLQRRLCRC